MEENFNPVAQNRANYYTPGSPVQFVRVELLRGDQSGENAVCLTFKNIGPDTLTGLKVRFKCKGTDGAVLCEDMFEYEDAEAATGELFGMDDAVFVTDQGIGSVDVVPLRAQFGRRSVSLEECKRVRLPAPKRLAPELSAQLQARIGREGLRFMPQILENGWYCACGAFHPNEENTVYCSECGSDRILLQNAINTLLQPGADAEPTRVAQPPVDEPTRVAGAAPEATRVAPAQDPEATRVAEAQPQDDGETREVPKRSYRGDAADHFEKSYRAAAPEKEPAEDPRDVLAENLIRWVPPATAIVCALIALGGFVYCNLIL